MNALEDAESIAEAMGDFVEPYITAITRIPFGEEDDPMPGSHWGTGSFVCIDGRPHLLTCEHVVRERSKYHFGCSLYGAEYGTTVTGFRATPYPLDFALADLQNAWHRIRGHRASCITPHLFSATHSLAPNELLYVYGFPGSEARALFGNHIHQGIGVFTKEFSFDPSLMAGDSKPNAEDHIFLAYSPEAATLLAGSKKDLPMPDGMSGSLVWNTRRNEVQSLGRQWTPSDARVIALVWGHSSKDCMLVATRIERIRAAYL